MTRTQSLLTVAATAALMLFSSGCDKLKSRDHLNRGVQAFKSAKYPDAIDHFRKAIELDDSNPNARLYLATAYMTQWIPGADSPENNELAKKAKDEFAKVLAKDANDKTAIASLASLNYNQAQSLPPDRKAEKFNEAREWYTRLVQVDPKNKEAYYSLGVISWAKWYPALMTARAKLSMKPEDPGPVKDKKVKEELKAAHAATIEDGITNLQKALDIDKEYDDAMAYMNLLIRERADLADDKAAYDKDVAVADSWVQKALDTKKLKASRTVGATGITQDK